MNVFAHEYYFLIHVIHNANLCYAYPVIEVAMLLYIMHLFLTFCKMFHCLLQTFFTIVTTLRVRLFRQP